VSFNLNTNQTQEAFFTWTTLMHQHQYRVMVLGYDQVEGQRMFYATYTNPKGTTLIRCLFEYSQSGDKLRVSWFNSTTGRCAKILLDGVWKSGGNLDAYRGLMFDVFMDPKEVWTP